MATYNNLAASGVGTKEWLESTKGMVIKAYTEHAHVSAGSTTTPSPWACPSTTAWCNAPTVPSHPP